MRIKVKKINGIYTEINLSRFTQLIGINIIEKNHIIESIKKYFSTEKYKEIDEKNKEIVFNDEGKIGRKYFEIIYIDSKETLIETIKISKNSIMTNALNQIIADIDVGNELERISDCLNNISIMIEKKLQTNIMLDFEIDNILNIVSKYNVVSKNEENIEKLTFLELLNILFDILKILMNRQYNKFLIIIKNIDHFLTLEEYKEFYKNSYDLIYKMPLYVLTSSSINKYIILDEEIIDGINIINKDIFIAPNYELFLNFLQENYPLYNKIENISIEDLLCIMQYIGDNNYIIGGKKEIYLKLLNKSLKIDNICKKFPNFVENNYIII